MMAFTDWGTRTEGLENLFMTTNTENIQPTITI